MLALAIGSAESLIGPAGPKDPLRAVLIGLMALATEAQDLGWLIVIVDCMSPQCWRARWLDPMMGQAFPTTVLGAIDLLPGLAQNRNQNQNLYPAFQ